MSDKSTPPAPPDASESPPTSRPRREGNESLWKRARRTLGTNSLTFLQPQSRPPGTATATGSGPAPPNKRREQVRHAQRTHRQRTQNYIKTLESEVVRLRESETRLIEERDKLLSQIENLKTTVRSGNLPLPAGFEGTLTSVQAEPEHSFTDFDMPATISYSTDDLAHQRLHVDWPTRGSLPGTSSGHRHEPTLMENVESPQDFSALPDLSADFSMQAPSLSTDSPSPFVLSTNPSPFRPPADTTTSPHPNSIQTAIEFVLALEHPCMQHIPYPADPQTAEPVNHVMMLSAPLVARAPESPVLNSSWKANGAIIKELLNLSSSINLDGEITPVEAWHRLHQHPDFWRLDMASIDRLKRDLSGAVRCCGFGAVLDEQYFVYALNNIFASMVVPQRGR